MRRLEMRNEKVEMRNENKQFKENNIIKEEPKSLNWIDKNKFKEILAIIDSNQFSYKNKIDEFSYIDIKDLVNDIRNNTISEIDAKKDLNTLDEIKNVELIKYKKRTPRQKELLKLFDELSDIILTDKTLKNQENENEKVESTKEENEKAESRKEENEYEDYEYVDENEDCENKNEYEYENKDENEDDQTIDQNKKIKILNDYLDEIIHKSKSFEEQIESLKKRKDLKGYWPYEDYDDKVLESK